MTEKRFDYTAYDDGTESIYDKKEKKYYFDMQLSNIEELLNDLSDENEQLKQEYQKLKHRHSLLHDVCIEAECDRDSYHKDVLSLEKENGQLKKELVEFKKWEKYVGDVKREELDRVFKMSIYEIAEAFEYYEKRIKELQRND